MAEDLAAQGCVALVSFGLAGGLDPALASGTVVLPKTVHGPGGNGLGLDLAWRRRLADAIGKHLPVCTGDVAGVDAPLATVADKAALFARTGSVAVDMESHAVAEVAARCTLPCLVVRAIADPAGRRVPRWLDRVVATDGTPRLGRVMAGLAAHPADLPDLVRLATASSRGIASLRGVAALGGPRLLFLA